MSTARLFAELFEEPPETWRTRGDPYLWAELRLRLGELPLPETAEALWSRLEQEFVAITGHALGEREPFFVAALAHGGLSSGYVTPDYWRTTIFPALLACRADTAFTLKRTRWYACELIGAEFGQQLRAYTPIQVRRCTPLKTGGGRLELTLRYAKPPDAHVEPKLVVQVIERNRYFLLARWVDRDPARLLLVHAIDWNWVRQHLDGAQTGKGDVQAWLATRCG